MAFRELRDYLAALEARGEPSSTGTPRSVERRRRFADRWSGRPAISSRRPGSSVAAGDELFATMERMCLALGVRPGGLDEHRGARPGGHRTGDPHELTRKAQDAPRSSRGLADFVRRPVSSAPCHGVVRIRPPVVPSGGEDVAGGRGHTPSSRRPKTGRRRRRDVPDARLRRDDDGDALARAKGLRAAIRVVRGRGSGCPVAVALGRDPATIYGRLLGT